jgi:hypothetical protein
MPSTWQQLELVRAVGECRSERLPSPRRRRRATRPLGWLQLGLPFDGPDNYQGPMLVTARGETKTVYGWAHETGLCAQTIYKRLASGYAPESAVSPFRPSRKADADIPPGEPGSLSWDLLEWDEDPWAWRVVAMNGDGMLLGEVGEMFALSEQRIEEVEKVAWRKVKIGEELVELLGWPEAEPRLISLRGEALDLYERMLAGVRKLVAGRNQQRAS